MHIYEGLISNNEANCLDPDFGLDYCPDDDEDEDDEETTVEPMTGTTEPATWPTLVPTTMEIDTTTTVQSFYLQFIPSLQVVYVCSFKMDHFLAYGIA